MLRYASGANTLVSGGDQDISGAVINATATGGAGGGTVTSFGDGTFEVYNTADSTKVGKFDASGITTATTRTYGMPDASGTMALISLSQTWTALQTFGPLSGAQNGNEWRQQSLPRPLPGPTGSGNC